MNPKTSLFSRSQPRVAFLKTKNTQGFLALPGEIRNQIYQYYFQCNFHCEFVGEDCDFNTAAPKNVKLLDDGDMQLKSKLENCGGKLFHDSSVILRFPYCHRAHHTASNLRLRWLDPLCALVVVCKQIRAETLPLLYHRITFVFEAPRHINNFFRVVPMGNLDNVTRLHLHYTTYGNPSFTSDLIWQKKHIASWRCVCEVASKRLTSLRALTVDVFISEDAPRFNLRQKWLQPLFQFRRLVLRADRERDPGMSSNYKSHILETVNIRLKSRLWTHDFEMNAPLAKACKHLHRLFGQGISLAILGAKEEEAMAEFDMAWNGDYKIWQHHLGFAKTSW